MMNETNLNHFISNIYNFHYKTLKMYMKLVIKKIKFIAI